MSLLSERGVDGKKVNKKGHMGTPVFWRYYLGSISGDGEKKSKQTKKKDFSSF